MALKIFDENGTGTGMEAVGAYNYIYKAQQLGTNIVAVNNSWGGTGDDEESKILKNLIDLVGENGAISVCAAGNDGADNDTYSDIPSGIDSDYIISVAASNEKDELATFSNYGKESVDIAAPGTDILSTVSYDCFNPGIYADTDALCSTFYDYNSGEVVQTIDSKGYNGVVCGAIFRRKK
jgi:subtilisin family serine protease